MELNGTMSLLVNREYTEIEFRDRESRVRFLKVRLTNDQLASVLSRLSDTPCKSMEVCGLEKLGKKMEHKKFEFKLPIDHRSFSDKNNEKVKEIAKKKCPKGWEPDLHFGSRDSFFHKPNKSGKEEEWARCTIRRWV